MSKRCTHKIIYLRWFKWKDGVVKLAKLFKLGLSLNEVSRILFLSIAVHRGLTATAS